MPHGAGQLDATYLTALVEELGDAVIVVDRSGVIRYANPTVRDLLGYEPADLVGQDYHLLVPDDAREAHRHRHLAYVADPVRRPMGGGSVLRARCGDGTERPVEVALVPTTDRELLVTAVIRDTSATHRLLERLDATNALLTAALAGGSRDEIERGAVKLLRDLLGADAALFGRHDSADGTVHVTAASGDAAVALVGCALAITERIADAGPPEVVDLERFAPDDVLCRAELHELGPALVVRFQVGAEPCVLAAVRRGDPDSFTAVDREVAHRFADALAVTVELVVARDDVEQLSRLADHDRIARDLHDTVIQRLFAIAMRLEAAVPAAEGVAAARMAEAVDELDGVVRDIRTTIFNLRRPLAGRSVRAEVAAEVDQAAELLGFAPRLRFIGPIESTVPVLQAEAVPTVVREALSNVVRHSGARRVDVAVSVVDDELLVTVADDGVGIAADAPRGNGLANLEQRALAFGGRCGVRAGPTGGTVLEWRAPVVEAPGDQ